jgi:hypothetical protein
VQKGDVLTVAEWREIAKSKADADIKKAEAVIRRWDAKVEKEMREGLARV